MLRRNRDRSEKDKDDDGRIGSKIGDYRIDSLIAVGGMGEVYAATKSDGTKVALKLVKENYAHDDMFRARFQREARIAQTIDNPHVVSVLDTGEHQGLPFLIERYVEGGSLHDRLQRDHTLDVPTMVRLATEVADGLGALWEAGMVHRDIKPGNILFDLDGGAHITDFGLAKDTQGTSLTRPGQALGSMDYMSPEQIRGEPVTEATDIYALACVMYECVCGTPPFADRPGMRVMWAHLQDEPADPCANRDDIRPEFVDTLMLGLRKDPAQRPQTGAEYARALSEAAGIRA